MIMNSGINNFKERKIEANVVSDLSDYREISAIYLPWREPQSAYEIELANGERKKAITGMSILIGLGVLVTIICVATFKIFIIPFGLAMVIGGIIALVKAVKSHGRVCVAKLVNIKEIYTRSPNSNRMRSRLYATVIVDEPEKLIVRSYPIARQNEGLFREGDNVLLSYNVSMTINTLR